MILDQERAAAVLPAYEIGGELGRGGWGAVLEGRHRQLGREVAIKQLPRAFAASPDVRARFRAEAQVLASFDHPHIVPVYDFVDADGLCLLVMEKLTRGTVWSRFVSQGFTTDQACAVVLSMCAALEHAHRQGILHRDVKPENVMFSSRGVLKVTDFGIAKMIGGSEHLMTRAGEVLGTPAYMAPEQAQAGELTPATDVYATGILLYELLSGQLPYPDDADALALLYRHVHEDPRPIDEVAPALPPVLSDTVMRSLARAPADRYPSAEAFGVALAQAATRTCGPGWMMRSDIPLMASGTIMAATERPSGNGGASAGAVMGAASPTIVDEPAPAPPPPVPPVSRPRSPAPATVRPSIVVHARGASADEVAATADVVPLREGLPRPPFPRMELGAVVVLLVVLLAAALSGLGTRSPRGDLAPGEVSLAQTEPSAGSGSDATDDRRLTLDLTEPVHIAAAPGIDLDGVRLDLTAAGTTLASATGTAEPAADGTSVARLDLSGARYLAAGPTSAELRLPDGRRQVLVVRSRQPALLTVPGAGGVAAGLLVAAYAESLFRSLRRGRKAVSGTVGLVVLGGTAGVVAVDLAWLAGRTPSLATAVVCAVVGAGAGLALARLGLGISRWRRPRSIGRGRR